MSLERQVADSTPILPTAKRGPYVSCRGPAMQFAPSWSDRRVSKAVPEAPPATGCHPRHRTRAASHLRSIAPAQCRTCAVSHPVAPAQCGTRAVSHSRGVAPMKRGTRTRTVSHPRSLRERGRTDTRTILAKLTPPSGHAASPPRSQSAAQPVRGAASPLRIQSATQPVRHAAPRKAAYFLDAAGGAGVAGEGAVGDGAGAGTDGVEAGRRSVALPPRDSRSRVSFSNASRRTMSLGCLENDSNTSPTTRSASFPSSRRITGSASGASFDMFGS